MPSINPTHDLTKDIRTGVWIWQKEFVIDTGARTPMESQNHSHLFPPFK
jgi:hypothetical protein